MTPLHPLVRSSSPGWIGLARFLAQAPARRRPAFALTEPVVFRSECFAEDLVDLPTPAPAGHPRPPSI